MAKQDEKAIKKRKWPATYDFETGNWYTGYDGSIQIVPTWQYVKDTDGNYIKEEYTDALGNTRIRSKVELSKNPKHVQKEVHEIRELTLRYDRYTRGRSAANFILVDEMGYSYETSCSGFDEFLTAIFSGDVYGEEGGYADKSGKIQKTTWFTAEFIQAKQGANIFIEYFGKSK